MSALLQVEKLETAYGASQVLFGVDFAIRPGEVATLLGLPEGTVKSRLHDARRRLLETLR